MVLFGWKRADDGCREHPGSHCLFQWVPCFEQVELDLGVEELYLDSVVSVSGQDEDEEKLVLQRSLLHQFSFFSEVS